MSTSSNGAVADTRPHSLVWESQPVTIPFGGYEHLRVVYDIERMQTHNTRLSLLWARAKKRFDAELEAHNQRAAALDARRDALLAADVLDDEAIARLLDDMDEASTEVTRIQSRLFVPLLRDIVVRIGGADGQLIDLSDDKALEAFSPKVLEWLTSRVKSVPKKDADGKEIEGLDFEPWGGMAEVDAQVTGPLSKKR